MKTYWFVHFAFNNNHQGSTYVEDDVDFFRYRTHEKMLKISLIELMEKYGPIIELVIKNYHQVSREEHDDFQNSRV